MKPRIVKVPDLAHPSLCWKQKTKRGPGKGIVMSRCVKKKGHRGKHTWEED